MAGRHISKAKTPKLRRDFSSNNAIRGTKPETTYAIEVQDLIDLLVEVAHAELSLSEPLNPIGVTHEHEN